MGRLPRPLSPVALIELECLRDTMEQIATLEAGMENHIIALRRRPNDVPWSTIGAVLGISAQAAQQRYRDVAPKVRNRRPTRAEKLDRG